MKKQEWEFSLKLCVCFIAALTIAGDQDIVYYKCRDFPDLTQTSKFEFACDGGKIIIVKSAIIGVTDKFSRQQCPITNNTCLMETTMPAELCTGRNACVINQNFLLDNEWRIPCDLNGRTVGNFININYTCILPVENKYGDICHFDEALYSNDSVYISSYPNFPEVMGPDVYYQCSCRFWTASNSSSDGYVSIRALQVKLTGAVTTCSEKLSTFNSKNETGLTFCSPCNGASNVTITKVASNPVILFRRDPLISPFNGKFILEITVSSNSSGSGSMGSMRCGYVDSIMSSSTSFSALSTTYISTTTISAILSQPYGVSSTNVQNSSLGSTTKLSNLSANTQQNTMSSSNTASDTQNAAFLSSNAPPNGDYGPSFDSQNASGNKSISTGGIIGIVLGSVGFIAIVIVVILCLLRKKKQHQDNRNGNTHFKLPKPLTVIQNLHRTSKIEFDDAASSELHTFQSVEQFSSELQTRGYENNGQRKDDYVSNYEEGAPVHQITNGPGMISANQRRRLSDKMADDPTTEIQSRKSGVDEVTLVENQLYGEYETTNATTSSDYDVVRPVVASSDYDVAKPVSSSSHYDVAKSVATSSDYDVAKPVATSSDYDVAKPVVAASDYDVVRPVVQDARTNESSEVDRGYAQIKNSSADHSYYNVPFGTRVQPPAEVSGIEATNPVHEADSDVVLIDNTLYGSILSF